MKLLTTEPHLSTLPFSRSPQVCEAASCLPGWLAFLNGEWGDHVTLQAAADLYGVKIFVLTSFKDTCYIEILPHDQKSERSKILMLISFSFSWV
ncbi:hypothetical protein GOBAR_AA35979 [Gossypium barbadense]|uniref:OTU domain-containing protein n=1 Tax=Gossypium barbadense TaxID=3634 RepID=A0A2P5W0W8_GOSBA|nr:hypothetical protein GOBAR_AA35979 [Gossypium barbadense]